ncbi:MAG TPA: alpha/beta hydrolase [Steroidobacteraceae bacterium]|nr:alpha/beta hydrolase [Steroidobacteraceae bacterium]
MTIMKLCCAALLFAITCLTTTMSSAAGAPAVAAAPVLDDRYPRAEVAFAQGVTSLPDLIYSQPPGFRPLRLDLYKPKAASKTGYPLVVYIHGGGWQSGHTRHSGAFANWPSVLASLAAQGFVVVSIEYRLSSEATFPAAIQDVKTSIRWLRSKADEFSIDRKRAIVWGGSAGGQLAALAATSCNDQALAPLLTDVQAKLKNESDCVQGVVAWYGIFDFSSLPEFSGTNATPNVKSAAAKYLDCQTSNCGERLALASTSKRIGPSTPPVLLIHGDKDQVVPVDQSRSFHVALRAKNIPAELMVIEGVDHSFIGATPEQTRKASLDALSKTIAFIKSTAGASGS